MIEFTRRLSNGFGGRFNYTYSVLKDNQIGETNFYSSVSPQLPMNNYNYIPSMPACAAGQDFTTACYDPQRGVRLRDPRHAAPPEHRADLRAAVRAAARSGRRAASATTSSAAGPSPATMSFQSGFPINIQQAANSLLGGAERQSARTCAGVDLATAGDLYDRLASADHPTATWINPAAFTLAPAGTFGNAPRTITDVRTPGRRNVDASFIKNIRLGGTKTAQFKMEIINLLNRPNVRSLQGRTRSATPLRPHEHAGRVHAAVAVHVPV